MTVSSETFKDIYTGNGSTTVYSYTFFILDEQHLSVVITDEDGVETTQVLNTDYTVSGVGDSPGGAITFTTAPASTDTVTIKRSLPITQAVDYQENDTFPAEVQEAALDKLTMIDQMQQEDLNRSIKVASSVSGFDITLPSATANGLIGFNATADGLDVIQLADASTITVLGTTVNGFLTYTDATNWAVESNMTFDGSALTVTGTAGISGAVTTGDLGVTGNITVSGTVDGRDVATDGTKLDGIEPGATADQSAAEIKAAYESNADTNAYDDAAVSKLAGIEPGATADQTAGEIEAIVDHDNLVGFVANEHIDWTSTTESLSTSGTAATGALSVTGNITVSGTVDGRDVATDGTKLDGIEAGADVTDETNVTDALDGATLTDLGTPAAGDLILLQDASDSNNLKVAQFSTFAGGGAGDAWSDPVDADIVPDADGTRDLGTTATRFAETYTDALDVTNNIVVGGTVDGRDLATDGTKLDGIEAGADVTDETNVTDALDGATLTDVGTPASGDLILLQDASDSNNLKVAQFSTFGGGGGSGHWQLVSQSTASSSTSIDFTGLTAESKYVLILEKVIPQNNDRALYLTCSTDNGSSFAALNYQFNMGATTSGTGTDSGNLNATEISLTPSSGTSGREVGNAGTGFNEYGYNATVNLYTMNDASYPMSATWIASWQDGDGDLWTGYGSGVCSDDAAGGATLEIDAIRLTFETGNIASGTFTLYKLVDA